MRHFDKLFSVTIELFLEEERLYLEEFLTRRLAFFARDVWSYFALKLKIIEFLKVLLHFWHYILRTNLVELLISGNFLEFFQNTLHLDWIIGLPDPLSLKWWLRFLYWINSKNWARTSLKVSSRSVGATKVLVQIFSFRPSWQFSLTNTRETGHECHLDFRVALAIASAERAERTRWSQWPNSRVVNYFGLACIG